MFICSHIFLTQPSSPTVLPDSGIDKIAEFYMIFISNF